MIVNGDETMALYVPSYKYTMAERGSQDILIVGYDGKAGNTVTLSGNAMGEMLPSQVIYKGMPVFYILLLLLFVFLPNFVFFAIVKTFLVFLAIFKFAKSFFYDTNR